MREMRNKYYSGVTLVVILVMLCGFLALKSKAADTATVLRVIDGDTCLLEDGRQIRYLGIDAPENGDFLFEEAVQANNRLVGGKEIRLELGSSQKDKGGRFLAYVSVDDVFVNLELVRQGYAHIQRPLGAKYRDVFLKAQEEARAARRGIWEKMKESGIVAALVHFNAEGNDWQNLNDEYIVIENQADEPVDLTGWMVCDEANHRYLFPKFVLSGKASVTLRTGLGRNAEDELFWGSGSPVWNNDGDTIFIRDSEGNLVLSYVY